MVVAVPDSEHSIRIGNIICEALGKSSLEERRAKYGKYEYHQEIDSHQVGILRDALDNRFYGDPKHLEAADQSKRPQCSEDP